MSLDRVRCAAIIAAAIRPHVHSVVLQLKAASCLRDHADRRRCKAPAVNCVARLQRGLLEKTSQITATTDAGACQFPHRRLACPPGGPCDRGGLLRATLVVVAGGDQRALCQRRSWSAGQDVLCRHRPAALLDLDRLGRPVDHCPVGDGGRVCVSRMEGLPARSCRGHASRQTLMAGHAHRPSRRVLARPPSRDLTRHGCA
ncbi:hypothetical protein LMG31886_07040 [Xanthomonas hydrangeae]|nr:hypothetical protein LMG31884_07130 [Xanthomonas hydrangeae]CAD7713646.1 hypothetical protein LMG31884_07130 [Xanthomonas hydrangeae]CAD7720605.1 hypothetical protein LMG31887_07130 [Xanthomonas hydrangeae]CAD7720609.1 hypothetical protein LMG31887_07130 [Xanthomonas hydrangeae]CAD7724867.1 hypothetical protein LMG31886_07040 [Xanthomonas hydrangeae]